MPLIATARGDQWIERLPDANPPPLILIHGAGGLHSDWSAALRARGAALDLPGHGSSPGAARSTAPEYAEDVAALMDALGLERAIIAGHSLGGAIALTLALEHPARVSGLILVAAGAKLAVHPDILDNLQSNLEAAALRLSGWFWAASVDPALKQAQHTRLLAALPGALLADFSAANSFDARARLGEIHAPTLIVCGEDDVMTPPKFSRYLHDRIAGSKLAIIPGAGHMLPLEQPDALDAEIGGWLPATP
jgi:pimeloyl-ACP methyl ester carboxylesterase